MLPSQCRMARVALKLGVRELGELAKVSTNTITRFEKGEGQPLKARTVEDIRAALERAGVAFLESGEVSPGPGVALSTALTDGGQHGGGISEA